MRRLLAIAAVLDGASRTEAAKIGGMDRQTLRDWVIRSPGTRSSISRGKLCRSPIANGQTSVTHCEDWYKLSLISFARKKTVENRWNEHRADNSLNARMADPQFPRRLLTGAKDLSQRWPLVDGLVASAAAVCPFYCEPNQIAVYSRPGVGPS